jgi:hypothetical protein
VFADFLRSVCPAANGFIDLSNKDQISIDLFRKSDCNIHRTLSGEIKQQTDLFVDKRSELLRSNSSQLF